MFFFKIDDICIICKISALLCGMYQIFFPVHHCSFDSLQYVISQLSVILSICDSKTVLCWYQFFLFSLLSPLTFPSFFFFLRLFPQFLCDFSYPVNTTL